MRTTLRWPYNHMTSIHSGMFKETSFYEITLTRKALPGAREKTENTWVGTLTPNWVTMCTRNELEPGLYNAAGEKISAVPDSLIARISPPLTTTQELLDSFAEIQRVFQEDFAYQISLLIEKRRSKYSGNRAFFPERGRT